MIIDSPIISGSYLSTGSLSQTGNVSITGSLTATGGISGSFSGSGANLFDIPAAGIVGLNLSQIASGSVSASISPNQGLLINTSVSASNFTGSFTGSLTGIATSASYASFALTSSYSLGGSGFPFSGSAVITGSLIVSGSGLTITGSVAISTLTTGSGVRYVIADADGLISAQTASAVIFTTQQTIATAGQTVFPITNGYSTGYVTVFVNGSKLNEDEFTDTSGTDIVFATGSMVNDVVEFQKYLPASGVSNNTLRTTNYFTTTLGQTNFTVNYTPGLLDVFYNGSKLSNAEYTAANGTSITLATGSNAGDTVEVDAYSYQVGAFSGIGGSGVARELAFYNTSNSITGSNKVTYDGSTFSVTGSFLVTGSSTFTNIGPAVFSGSVTAVGGFTGSFSGNADSASLAQNSLLLQGTGSVGFTTTASFLTVSSSQQQISASQQQLSSSFLTLTASFNAVSASQQQISSSYIALSASYNVASSSFSTRITSDSSSLSSRTTQIENVYATTGSNTFTGVQNFSNTCTPNGFNSGASLYTAGGLQVTQDTYFSSSVYIKGNVTVYGTQSVSYVSSSQFNIGTNIITVNTFTPSVRFGGLSVFDSGSTGLTGSIFWDSELNRWIYTNASGSGGGATYGGGMFISGPRNTQGLGCEQGTTACMLLVGQGGDHLTSSMIYHDTVVTCIPNAIVGGSTISGTTIYGSTAVCSPVGKFTTCIDAGSGTFSSSVTATSLYATVGSVSITQDGTYGSNYGMIGFGGTTNGSNRIFAGVGTYDGLYLASATGKNIEFRPAGTFAMTILSTGSVGIGTNSPSQLLHLETTLASCLGVGTSIQITSGGAGGDQAWIGVNKGTGNGLEFSVENRDIIFNTLATTPFGGTERMRITCTGNFGFNITTPNAISGYTRYTFNTESTQANGSIIDLNVAGVRKGTFYATPNEIYIGSDTAIPAIFLSSGNERMRICATGDSYFTCALFAKALGTNDLILNNLNYECANYVDGTRGSWLIQEGACDLFIINQVSCKKYKFNLIEIK